MDDRFFTQLLGGIHGDLQEVAPDPPPVLYKVTITYDGANIRRQPAIGNNLVRTARKNDIFLTPYAETTDNYSNRWIQISEGFIATYYNRTLRATIEVI